MGYLVVKNRHLLLLLAAMAALPASAQPLGNDWVYKTYPGDTLISIAGRYLTNPDDWTKLQAHNKLKNPHHLLPGTSIAMPVNLLRQGSVSAKIVSLKGQVEAVDANGAKRALESGAAVAEGETIRTGDNSTLILQFVDGSQAFVLANSKMTLTQLRAYTTTGIVDTRMKLDAGRIETAVKPLQTSAARYEVQTPATQIGVRGTNFRIAADPAFGRTEVLEGKVVTEASSQKVDLPAGFGSKTETGKPPAPPVELLPNPNLDSNPVEIQKLPVRLTWADVPKAVSYRAQLSNDKSFTTLNSDSVFISAEAKFADLADGKYAVKVRAIDPAGLEGQDTIREFAVDARPDAPSAILPENKTSIRGDKAEFKWNAAPNLRAEKIAQYHFQLAADAEFKQLLSDLPAHSGTATDSTLKPGDYFWRVASKMSNGKEGAFSEPMKLSMVAIPPPRALPPAPNLVVPNVGENMLLFNWTAPIATQKFVFQLARDAEFKTIVAEKHISETRLYLPRPTAGGNYFARVRLHDSEDYASEFSAAQKMALPQK